MDISPAARIPNGHLLVDARGLPGGTADARAAAASRPGPGQPGGPDASAPVPFSQVGGTVSVEFARHASGVHEVKFFDKRTGELISTTPCEKVLDAVTALIDLVRKKA